MNQFTGTCSCDMILRFMFSSLIRALLKQSNFKFEPELQLYPLANHILLQNCAVIHHFFCSYLNTTSFWPVILQRLWEKYGLSYGIKIVSLMEMEMLISGESSYFAHCPFEILGPRIVSFKRFKQTHIELL